MKKRKQNLPRPAVHRMEHGPVEALFTVDEARHPPGCHRQQ